MTMPKDACAGFARPTLARQSARQRTALALIASAALAVSTVIAATAVTIGIARAGEIAAAGGSDGHIAVALFLGIVFAGMGALTAVTAWHGAGTPRED
ncbi:MAG: hypothetical protein WD073_10580 [Xanthobacteraceae bacterium]